MMMFCVDLVQPSVWRPLFIESWFVDRLLASCYYEVWSHSAGGILSFIMKNTLRVMCNYVSGALAIKIAYLYNIRTRLQVSSWHLMTSFTVRWVFFFHSVHFHNFIDCISVLLFVTCCIVMHFFSWLKIYLLRSYIVLCWPELVPCCLTLLGVCGCMKGGRHSLGQVNSSPPSAAYMHLWTGSALVQIIACGLDGT